ncbi:MAG: N-acetylmuramoyl-L-alanine amidase [Lachnospiraceae bacterium]|nr:N-acetylmuramoyl-L-alanine amidase [Lachnospiraceae bacterium]
MEITEKFVTTNPCYTAGKKINVKGLMLHSVGCPQPSAEVFIKQFDNPASKVCVHAFIDANTGMVYQTLPWDYKAWHCGANANSTHIGVEMCEPPCIRYTGGSTFTCSDEQKAREMVMRTLNSAVKLFAFLCKKYGLKPIEDGVIISHKEGHDRGMASGHGDPDHLFRQLNMGYTMDNFRRAVAAAMDSEIAQPVAAPTPVKGEMEISAKGIELIAGYEGCRLEAYKCPAGVWTIGYGHTAGVQQGQTLPSKEAAKELLKEDLKKYAGYVNNCVKKGLITFPLNQNQFDALTSFCYNCGNGNLQKLVEGRDAATVADKLLAYNKGGGKVLPGLARRRADERALFLS